MKKKILSILLAVCLVTGCLPLAAGAAEGEGRSSVTGESLLAYSTAANWYGNLTRLHAAELVTALYEAASGKEAPAGDVSFPDTDSKAAAKAASLGIVSDTSATKFSPSLEVSRGQMAVFCKRTLDAAGVDTAPLMKDEMPTMDVMPGTYYYDGVRLICGLTDYREVDFRPNGTVTGYDAMDWMAAALSYASGVPVENPIPPLVRATEIQLNDTQVTLEAGESYRLTATVLPENATYQDVTWEVMGDQSVVELKQDGTITGREAGTASVKAVSHFGECWKTCEVTVLPAVTAFAVNGTSGKIDNANKTISVYLPAGTDVRHITFDVETNAMGLPVFIDDYYADGGSEFKFTGDPPYEFPVSLGDTSEGEPDCLYWVDVHIGEDEPIPSSFSDVPRGEYYAEPVEWAVENGITSGTSATKFSPNNPCTRGQAVTFLFRSAGCPDYPGFGGDFADNTDKSIYYFDAINWAYVNGITNGTSFLPAPPVGIGPIGYFSPKQTCTRAQIVTFLWRAAGKPEPDSGASPFTDVSPSDYYYNAVLWAVQNNITTGTSATKFSPGTTCSRAQIVTFLYRYYQ